MLTEPGRYDYLPLIDRPNIRWPNGARVAFWVGPNIEFYEIDPPDGQGRPLWPRPYPDVLNYSLRDYGNRAGVWRVMEALEHFGVRASVSLNAAMCDHMPDIVDECVRLKWELFSHGIYNTRLISGMSEDEVRQMIGDSVETIKRHSGQDVAGWLAPAISATETFFDLLPEFGIKYTIDMVPDDQPIPIKVRNGRLISIPYSTEINDIRVMGVRGYPADKWAAMIKACFDQLYRGGRGQRHGRVHAASSVRGRAAASHRGALRRAAARHVAPAMSGSRPPAKSPTGTTSTTTTRLVRYSSIGEGGRHMTRPADLPTSTSWARSRLVCRTSRRSSGRAGRLAGRQADRAVDHGARSNFFRSTRQRSAIPPVGWARPRAIPISGATATGTTARASASTGSCECWTVLACARPRPSIATAATRYPRVIDEMVRRKLGDRRRTASTWATFTTAVSSWRRARADSAERAKTLTQAHRADDRRMAFSRTLAIAQTLHAARRKRF